LNVTACYPGKFKTLSSGSIQIMSGFPLASADARLICFSIPDSNHSTFCAEFMLHTVYILFQYIKYTYRGAKRGNITFFPGIGGKDFPNASVGFCGQLRLRFSQLSVMNVRLREHQPLRRPPERPAQFFS
jgi:hypothetical protein